LRSAQALRKANVSAQLTARVLKASSSHRHSSTKGPARVCVCCCYCSSLVRVTVSARCHGRCTRRGGGGSRAYLLACRWGVCWTRVDLAAGAAVVDRQSCQAFLEVSAEPLLAGSYSGKVGRWVVRLCDTDRLVVVGGFVRSRVGVGSIVFVAEVCPRLFRSRLTSEQARDRPPAYKSVSTTT
jgi:hypothetical protein